MKVITFDIWDTILKRNCHPEEIKLYTCEYLLNKYSKYIDNSYTSIYKLLKLRNEIEYNTCLENEKKGYDKECNITEVFKKMENILFKSKIKGLTKELIEIEIQHEIESTYVNSYFLNLIKKYQKYDIYCISDFYMPSVYLKRILKSKGVLKYIKEIYSSADYLLTKRTGRLFKKVKEELNCNFNEIMHIGDNKIVDIKIPKELGIATKKVKNKIIYPNISHRKLDYNKILNISKSSKLHTIGKELSIIPFYFIYSVMQQNENNKIYYLTREGEFFQKIHRILKKNNRLYLNNKDELLEVSRISTFATSLKEFNINELMRIWKQYNKQDINTLYKSLNIDIDKYKEFFKKLNIDTREIITNPWENEKIQKLFNNKDFINKMNEEINNKKTELYKYFKKKGIINDTEPISIVDIGWRGTIQDNIAIIYNKKNVTGYYMALLNYFNEQPKNTIKVSIIKEEKFINEIIGGMITFFEMIFIPNSGSVLSYKNGKAVRKILEEEYAMITEYVIKLQEGMLEGANILSKYFNNHPYEANEIYELFKKEIIKIRKNPPKKLLEVYFKLVLNDTFGAGKYVKKNGKLKIIDHINFKKCISLMRKESWKEAFIKYNRLYILGILLKIKKIGAKK